jgi:glycine cleavage system aminomethyltransferase T/glycine/D-amino acid oxidase-like deaminating enzyme
VISQADVVVVGGGVVGCSVAYHLAKLGVQNVVLLERRQLTCGTTWHAAGLVPQMRTTRRLTELSVYGKNLYPELQRETGQDLGLRQNGSLNVATNHERLEEILRGASMARSCGVDAYEVSSREAADLWPGLEIEDVVGAVFIPADGQLNPVDLTMAFAKGARKLGVTILENVEVSEVLIHDGCAVGVATNQGEVKAQRVVNCGGMWARELAGRAGVAVPLHACEHFYALTEVIPGLPGNLPVLRNPDSNLYIKEDAGKLLIGAFESVAKPWGMHGIPKDFCFDELAEDLDHFLPILEAATVRAPILANTGIHTFFNGPESFTHDDHYLLGETPELKNFFVAAGFNSVGIQSAAGAGALLAQWLYYEKPPTDIWEVDVRRVFSYQAEQSFIQPRVSETLGLLYEMHWPHRQFETSRGIFKSSLHRQLVERGACFGEVAGWERANWFACGDVEPKAEYSYKRQNWFECSGEEHQAVRNTVGLFDQSSFAKFDVSGKDAEYALQRLCTNDIARPAGSVVYTQWLNAQGGIEADVTVTRVSETEYRVVTSPATRRKDYYWLKNNVGSELDCTISDVSMDRAVISLMGPSSRELIQSLSGDDWSDASFPFATAKSMKIGSVDVMAQRITYVGELGWELYCDKAAAPALFEVLMQRQATFELRLCGYHALNSCRIEKGYRSWGHDINDLDTPAEAGLLFAFAADKAVACIGHDAVLAQKEQGIARRIMQFALDDSQPLLYHNEPIYRDGMLAGHVTSGAFGYSLGRSVALGLINFDRGTPIADLRSSTYDIEIAGTKFSATASTRPLYDPKGERTRL